MLKSIAIYTPSLLLHLLGRRLLVAGVLLSLSLVPLSSRAQQTFFADGYHGGVYGHYPVAWYTQFLVDQLRQNPSWCLGLEIEPETWDTVRVRTPEAYLSFSRYVQSSRVEYTNPCYAQSYLYCVSGESVIRQFYYGIRKLRSHFPDVLMATYSCEEPCFTSCLPQILRQFGFRHAVLKCPDTCWGGYTSAYGGELVNWTGPDGTSLLSVPRYACEELNDKTVWQTMAWNNSARYLQSCRKAGISHPVGMCYQDAGWKNGPWLGAEGGSSRSTYVRWTDYIEKYSDGHSADDYHFTQEDVHPGLMWGTQVMQRLARSVRHTENLLVQAEKMAAMASLDHGFRPDQSSLDEAWRTLMLSQHHDCWIVPYNTLNRRGTWADNVSLWTAASDSLAHRVIGAATASYPSAGKTLAKGFVRVFNTLAHPRREPVTVSLADGRDVTFMASVPAFGYATYRADSLPVAQPAIGNAIAVGADSAVLENSRYRLVFDLRRGGVLTHLQELQSGYDYVSPGGARSFGELRGYFADCGRFCSSCESAATATIVADGPLRKTLRLQGCIAGVPFIEEITLEEGRRPITYRLTVNWTGNRCIGYFVSGAKPDMRSPAAARHVSWYDTRYMLSVLFPSSLRQPSLWKDAPFDVCRSRLANTFYNRWDSIKHNVILHWVDLAEPSGRGLALLSDHTTSYSFGTFAPLALTVQYAGPGLWSRDYRLDGPTELRFALVPHQGQWDEASLDACSDEWNEPLLAVSSPALPLLARSLLQVSGRGYAVSSAQATADGLLLRLYNASGDASPHVVTLPMPLASVVETDLLGRRVRAVSQVGPAFSVSMPRFGVRTYLIQFK